MANSPRDDVFKPNLSRTESKAESVSRVAKTAIRQEIASRDAKTARLRAARLARDAAAPAPEPVAPRRSRAKKASTAAGA
ncbi:hypothetical protein [Bosea sp. 117]|uniref:hypothetical protein n=1 Tax=Bosea sp. 117 TaxID=1125973 RepID=UPI0004943409|nr:hypothetical protein [Bosea sp. 117]